MEWLYQNYPKATMLDDYGMYGRDFPPATIEYVHAHWTREGDVYTKPKPVSSVSKPVSFEPKPVSLPKILTPEEARAKSDKPLDKPLDDSNKLALDVLLKKGPDQAAEFMMSSGKDYARMRMMYG
jgi:hypothetical protein